MFFYKRAIILANNLAVCFGELYITQSSCYWSRMHYAWARQRCTGPAL